MCMRNKLLGCVWDVNMDHGTDLMPCVCLIYITVLLYTGEQLGSVSSHHGSEETPD